MNSTNRLQEGSRSNSDAPEEIVKAENKAVQRSRLVVFVVLVSAASCTSGLVYNFIQKSEHSDFVADFNVVGSRLVESAVTDTALRLWMARTVSMAVSLSIQTQQGITALNMSFPTDMWSQITREIRLFGHAIHVTWSPLIKGDEERLQFEAYVKTRYPEDPLADACLPCGVRHQSFVNPDQSIFLAGFGEQQCGGIEEAMLSGLVTRAECPWALGLIRDCICGDDESVAPVVVNNLDIPDSIFLIPEGKGETVELFGQDLYSPIWEYASLNGGKKIPVMYNQLSNPLRAESLNTMLRHPRPVTTESYFRNSELEKLSEGYEGELGSILYYPVVIGQELVGSVGVSILWKAYLTNILPPNSALAQMVVSNTKGQCFTFRVELRGDNTPDLILEGEGDLHDPKYRDMGFTSDPKEIRDVFETFSVVPGSNVTHDQIFYAFAVYPTQAYEDAFSSDTPFVFSAITSSIFLFTSMTFWLYDFIVRRRQAKVMASAKRTNNIVSELFPQNVRDRLYATQEERLTQQQQPEHTVHPFRWDLSYGEESTPLPEPIADLFPHTTVIFIDIVSFTVWCSERDPSMTLYGAFDREATKHGVFKVETIGDCWVGVCGLPTPVPNHAEVIARFAAACVECMSSLTRRLEVRLGPSTSDLQARVGMNSGSVIGGVLRGDKARFQLFGDSVNVSSRMESTGQPMKIHASKETAELLIQSGKGNWVIPRKGTVAIKGKGQVQTYWIDPSLPDSDVTASSDRSISDVEGSPNAKIERLVRWNVEVLAKLLLQIVVHRRLYGVQEHSYQCQADGIDLTDTKRTGILDEIVPILQLPVYQLKPSAINVPIGQQALPCVVRKQLQEYVSAIAAMYRDVPFHNFSHASHVIMSASKLLKRIVNPDVDCMEENIESAVYRSTYGISGDPILQFSVAFSALIHDVDHTGCTNAELVEMGVPVAKLYDGKSVAEQNSVSIAWSVLMSDRYRDLRSCIYGNEAELHHFRKLVVNAVIATDIADKELKALREARWEDAFSRVETSRALSKTEADCRATIIFEYIIQCSDIAHTMQHWQTYRKWNRLLFEERYVAWVNGYAAKEPSQGWYAGELWFFDNYIIPTANKLNACGVFGVSYHELLRFAIENRREWEQKGRDIVAKMLKQCQSSHGSQVKSGRPVEEISC